MMLWIKVEVTDIHLLKQHKNANIANFVYYEN